MTRNKNIKETYCLCNWFDSWIKGKKTKPKKLNKQNPPHTKPPQSLCPPSKVLCVMQQKWVSPFEEKLFQIVLNNSFSVFWLNFITVGWLVKNPCDHVVHIWIHVKMFSFLICISGSIKIVSLSFRFPADICWCRWMVTEAQVLSLLPYLLYLRRMLFLHLLPFAIVWNEET